MRTIKWFPQAATNLNMIFFPNFKTYFLQKIEKPFLQAVSSTLGDRYTDNVEGIYKITIKFIIETLVEGFETGSKQQNIMDKSKNVNSNSNYANGANSATYNSDNSKTTTKMSTNSS